MADEILKLETIKDIKLNHMKTIGINDKYHTDLKSKKITFEKKLRI